MGLRNRETARASVSEFVSNFGETVCNARPFYNFGAGRWSHPLWRNIDITHLKYPNNRPEIEYNAFHDVMLPIESSSAHLFFFSHVNEHLTDDANVSVLREVHRSLLEGGVARFVFPDFDLAKEAYKRNDRDFFLYRMSGKKLAKLGSRATVDLFVEQFAPRAMINYSKSDEPKYSADEFQNLIRELGFEGMATKVCDSMNVEQQMLSPGDHINWFNYDKFRKLLIDAGFETIRKSAYLQSHCAPMRNSIYFDYRHPSISCYVEAVK